MKRLLAILALLPARLRLTLLLTLIIILVAAGGALGWKRYQYRKSPDYAVATLINALAPPRLEQLAALVDFRALAHDFAAHIYAARPQTVRHSADPQEAVALMADEVQRQLLAALEQALTPEKTRKPLPPDAPLAPLPDTLIPQLAEKLTLRSTRDNLAFLHAEIEYPRAETMFPLILLMEQRPAQGWVVTRVANAQDVVQHFVRAEASLQEQRQRALLEKNQLEQLRMDAQLSILSCTLHAERLSDKKTFLLTLEIFGFDKGPHSIHNLNFDVTIVGAGDPIQRRLNMARRIAPGEHFSYIWHMDLDPQNPEDKALMAASDLQCMAHPRAMALSSGELLYIRPSPTPSPTPSP